MISIQNPDNDDLALNEVYATSDNLTSFIFNPNQALPIQDQKQRLPIWKYKQQLYYCLEKYQVIVLVGETGSGKSTQIPQYLYETGWYRKGLIGITEPRRISAITLANRVALECGDITGNMVGYVVKFAERISEKTCIKFMTEGILLRELLSDPLLTQYSVIIIDEVHERNLLTDMLLGLLKKVIRKNNRLKLIISSATIDALYFKDFFDGKRNDISIILSVEGKMHPVQIFHLKEPCPDYIQETVTTIIKIHKNEPPGYMLAFLTGQEEVLKAINLLQEYANEMDNLMVLPLFGTLSNADQLKVFLTPKKGIRKVIISTNIAETSITIPGIVYVIDCGFTKLKWFNSESASDNLVVISISKSSAIQRAGRAGRTSPGKVYRLYTENAYTNMSENIPPDMRRTELSPIVLHLKALGIKNILRFDFLSPPPAKNLIFALESLYALGAINDEGNLTKPIGYLLAELPFGPMLNKMLLVSGEMGCTAEILIIISMLQVESVFSRSISPQAMAKQRIAIRNFEVVEGDLITMLNVFTAFVDNEYTKEFCGRYFLSYRNLKKAVQLHTQLSKFVAKKLGMTISSCNGDTEIICKCITAGLFLNTAYLHSSGVYRNIRTEAELAIHPTSTLYNQAQQQFVVYCDLLQTTKLFMNNVTVIKQEWLSELASNYYVKQTVQESV